MRELPQGNHEKVLIELEEVHRFQKPAETKFSKPVIKEEKTSFKQTSKPGKTQNQKSGFKVPYGVCKNCGDGDHFARDCQNPAKEGSFCFICGDEQHMSNECPKRPKKTQSNRTKASFMVQFSRDCRSSKPESDVVFCLDSGSTDHCVASKELLSEIHEVEPFSMVNSFGEREMRVLKQTE